MLRTLSVAITVFGCGWILMGLEIVGGRMLAPYFGTEAWVWGSVISVFLAALSIGYFLGGLLTQRFPHVGVLVAIILLAAASIMPAGLWYRTIGEWAADFDIHERWGALMTSAMLFLLPSVLLGMVSPYAVRLLTRRVDEVGARAGTLYAISTIGSFLGCLMTAFYFILWMGIQQILFLSAGTLLVIAIWQLLMWYAAEFIGKETSA